MSTVILISVGSLSGDLTAIVYTSEVSIDVGASIEVFGLILPAATFLFVVWSLWVTELQQDIIYWIFVTILNHFIGRNVFSLLPLEGGDVVAYH